MYWVEAATPFFGWCTVINVCLLAFISLILVTGRGWVTSMHAKMFGLSEERLAIAYFSYLAHLKIAVIVFNLVPWIALKLMA